MRKKVTTIILAVVITAAVSVPAWACTPRLDLKMPDLQSAYDSAYEAGKNAAKDIIKNVLSGCCRIFRISMGE